MTPSRPSEPRTISRTLGPVDVLGSGRSTSTLPGCTTRRPRVMSAMSPYLSDCMPEERVAIQPPSVLWVKLSGKWPMVQPRRPSCVLDVRAEHAGLDPGEPGLLVDLEHLVHPTQVEGDHGARLVGRRLRLPEMLLPPPKGMSTASAATARSTIRCTSSSSPG